MRPESALWKRIRPIFQTAKFDPVRVENPIHPGTPDVNFATGAWVELKSVDRWPAGEGTLLRIGHYTAQQRVFLYRRWKYAPGTTFLLLEVRAARQCLLFDGDVAAKVVGRATAAGHRVNARAILGEHELSELPKIFVEVDATIARPRARFQESKHE